MSEYISDSELREIGMSKKNIQDFMDEQEKEMKMEVRRQKMLEAQPYPSRES